MNDTCTDKEYAFPKSFVFSWNIEKDITKIIISKHNYIEVIINDSETYKLFSRYAQPEFNYVSSLNSKVKELKSEYILITK